MISSIKKILKLKILRDFGILLSGSVIAQLIPIALQPVIKRYYEPEVFGVYEVYFRVGNLLFIVYTLRYEISLFYPKTKEETKKLMAMVLMISFLFLVMTELVFLVNPEHFSNLIGLDLNYLHILFLIPLAGFAYAMFRVWTNYHVSRELLSSLSTAKVIRRSSEGAIQVGFGLLGKPIGLFIGELSGIFIAVAYMFNKERVRISEFFNFKQHLQKMKEEVAIPKFNLLPDLLNTFTEGILVFLVLKEFTLREVGLLELSLKVLIVPTALLAANIGPLIVQRITKALNQGNDYRKDLLTILIILTSVAVSFLIAVFTIGQPIFNWLFESVWEESYLYVKILATYAVIQLVIAPFGQVLVAFKKYQYDAYWKIFKFLLLSILFFREFETIEELLLLYTILASVIYIVYAVIIIFVLKSHRTMPFQN